jgi:hypothetical protein
MAFQRGSTSEKWSLPCSNGSIPAVYERMVWQMARRSVDVVASTNWPGSRWEEHEPKVSWPGDVWYTWVNRPSATMNPTLSLMEKFCAN